MADRVTALASRRRMMAMAPFPVEKSGELVNFNSKLKFPLKNHLVHIEPVQDLHGYDHPWPSGTTKNLYDYSTDTIGYLLHTDGSMGKISGWSVSAYISLSPNTDYIASNLSTGGDGAYIVLYDASKTLVRSLLITASEDLAFTTADNEVYVRLSVRRLANEHLTAQLEEGTVATDYIPGSNICPIEGFSGVKIVHTGKNLLNAHEAFANYMTYDEETDEWHATSAQLYNKTKTAYLKPFDIDFKPPLTFSFDFRTLSTSGSSHRLSVFMQALTADGTKVNYNIRLPDTPEKKRYSVTFPVGNGVLFDGIRFSYGKSTTCYFSNPQIEIGTDDTEYEPYSEEYSLEFLSEAGIVYGGTLDVKTGELTVDRAIIDGGSVDWKKLDTYAYGKFYANLPWKVFNYSSKSGILSSIYESVSGADATSDEDNYVWLRSTGTTTNQLRVKDDSKDNMTVEEFKAAMQGVQFSGILLTPITYTLTPIEITALLGQNNIWADTGVTDVTYWTTT